MKVLLLITKDFDGNTLYKTSIHFRKMIEECYTFLNAHYLEHTDKLTLEILLYLVNFFKNMLQYETLQKFIEQKKIINHFIEMLKVHD